MCRQINVLELLNSFSFNNSVILTRYLTITLLKSFFVEIGNIISHYNHLIHLPPALSAHFWFLSSCQIRYLVVLHGNTFHWRAVRLGCLPCRTIWARYGWYGEFYKLAACVSLIHFVQMFLPLIHWFVYSREFTIGCLPQLYHRKL